MKKLSDIAIEISEELGVSEEDVKANWEAWLKGTKQRIVNEPVTYFQLPKFGRFYYVNKMRTAFRYTLKNKTDSKEIRERLKEKKDLCIDFAINQFKLNEQREEKDHIKYTHIYHNQVPPLEFYGFLKGYDLKEMESKQQKVFDLMNKHNY